MSANGNGFAVEVGPPDASGRRVVVAFLGKKSHRDKFDPDDSFKRAKFREAVIHRFGFDESAHEGIEEKIQAAAAVEVDELWTPNTISLEDVEAKPVRWFWHEAMPEGAFSVLDADPNEGKTTVAKDIGARFTNGWPMPPHSTHFAGCESGNVLFMGAEDDLHRTTVPRFKAAGADMTKVFFLRTASIAGEDERIIQLPADFPIIEREIVAKSIRFLVIDVLTAFVQPGLDLNSDSAARQVTTPLANMLERTRCTALVLRHLNKKEGVRSMYRGGGSVGVIAAARAAFTIGPHPDEPGVRVWAPIKHNLGPKPPSLTFTIEAHEGSSRIVWGGHTDLSAADVLHPAKHHGGGTKMEVAKEIITDLLASGPRGSNEVETACLDEGISKSTYWNARRALNVQAEKTDFEGQWLLSLSGTNGHAKDVNDDF